MAIFKPQLAEWERLDLGGLQVAQLLLGAVVAVLPVTPVLALFGLSAYQSPFLLFVLGYCLLSLAGRLLVQSFLLRWLLALLPLLYLGMQLFKRPGPGETAPLVVRSLLEPGSNPPTDLVARIWEWPVELRLAIAWLVLAGFGAVVAWCLSSGVRRLLPVLLLGTALLITVGQFHIPTGPRLPLLVVSTLAAFSLAHLAGLQRRWQDGVFLFPGMYQRWLGFLLGALAVLGLWSLLRPGLPTWGPVDPARIADRATHIRWQEHLPSVDLQAMLLKQATPALKRLQAIDPKLLGDVKLTETDIQTLQAAIGAATRMAQTASNADDPQMAQTARAVSAAAAKLQGVQAGQSLTPEQQALVSQLQSGLERLGTPDRAALASAAGYVAAAQLAQSANNLQALSHMTSASGALTPTQATQLQPLLSQAIALSMVGGAGEAIQYDATTARALAATLQNANAGPLSGEQRRALADLGPALDKLSADLAQQQPGDGKNDVAATALAGIAGQLQVSQDQIHDLTAATKNGGLDAAQTRTLVTALQAAAGQAEQLAPRNPVAAQSAQVLAQTVAMLEKHAPGQALTPAEQQALTAAEQQIEQVHTTVQAAGSLAASWGKAPSPLGWLRKIHVSWLLAGLALLVAALLWRFPKWRARLAAVFSGFVAQLRLRPRRSVMERIAFWYARLLKSMARRGWHRRESETLRAFAHVHESHVPGLKDATEVAYRALYSPHALTDAEAHAVERTGRGAT